MSTCKGKAGVVCVHVMSVPRQFHAQLIHASTSAMQVVIPLGAMSWPNRYNDRILREQREKKRMQLEGDHHNA